MALKPMSAYTNDLLKQKSALVNLLTGAGVEASEDEKLNTLIPKASGLYESGKTDGLDLVESLLTSGYTDYSYIFYPIMSVMETVPIELLRHVAEASKLENLYYHCKLIKTVPEIDTSNATSFKNMFYHCEALEEVPPMDTSKGEAFDSMFYNCYALKEVPDGLNLSNGGNFYGMFYGCKALKTIPPLDLSNATSTYYMFSGCSNLGTIEKLTLGEGLF